MPPEFATTVGFAALSVSFVVPFYATEPILLTTFVASYVSLEVIMLDTLETIML